MSRKLVEATFLARSTQDAKAVIAAFSVEFPSLEGMTEVAGSILDYLQTGDFYPELQKAIDKGSMGGEWPAHIFMNVSSRDGKEFRREVVITPYIGDRCLRVHRAYAAWLFTADFTERPSSHAARSIIQLAEGPLKFNDPEWMFSGEFIPNHT